MLTPEGRRSLPYEERGRAGRSPFLGLFLTVLLAALSIAPASGEEIEVTGLVLAPDAHPRSGVRVTFLPVLSRLEQARRELTETTPEPAASAETDDQGFFHLAAPTPGMWTVHAEAPGFLPMELALKPLVRETTLPPLVLERDAGLRVLLHDGNRPVAGGRVRVEPVTPRPSRYGARPDWQDAPRLGRTGDDGIAVLPWRSGQSVRVLASAPGFAVEQRTVRRRELRLALSSGSKLVVEVRNPQGALAPGAVIRTFKDVWPLGETAEDSRATIHADDGTEVEVLAAGSLQFRGSLAKPADDEPVRIELAPPALLAGRVVEQSEPMPIAGALVWPAGDPGSFRRTDGRGGYELPAAGSGRTRLAAAAPGFFPGEQPVELAPGRVDVPALALEAMAAISGVVTGPDGEPLPGVEILAFPDGARRTRTGYRVAASAGMTYSRAAGRFEIGELVYGVAYRARFRKTGYGLAEVEVPVPRPGEAPAPLAVTLRRGQSVFGHVVADDETPVAGAEIRLRRAPSDDPIARIAEASNPRLVPSWDASTDRDGGFELDDLPTGRYVLDVRAAGFASLRLPGLAVTDHDAATDLGTVVLAPGATVEGYVRDAAGAPLEAVEVRVVPAGSVERTFADLRGGELPADAVTGPDGYFALRDRGPGERLELRFRRRGYARLALPGIEAPSEEPLAVVLGPVSRVFGRVVDESGAPLDGAALVLDRIETSVSAAGTTSVAGTDVSETTADDDGRFAFDDVEPGELQLSASAPGYATGEWTGLEAAPGEDLDLELALEPGASVRGTVFAPDAEALAGVRVRYESAGSRSLVRTDGEGRFRIEGAAVAQLTLVAEHERYGRAVREVDLAAGENLVDLRFERGLEARGAVVDETGAGVEGAVVRWMKKGDYMSLRRQASKAGGSFRFEGVAAGTYTLRATKEGYAGTPERVTVEVGDASLDGVVVPLVVGATLTGRLLGLATDELAAVEVEVGPYSKTIQVDPDGKYRIANVFPGTWTVIARHAGSERQASGEVTIEPGEVEVRLDLAFDAGRRLTGRVTSHGEGIAGALVALFGADGLPVAESRTDPSGAFGFRGLGDGTYRLRVLGPQGSVEHSEEVEVMADAEVLVELDRQAVAGYVVRADDASPLGGVRVTLAAAEGRPGRETTTDARGYFRFPGVARGSWRLVARKAGFEPAETLVALGPETASGELRIALTPSPE